MNSLIEQAAERLEQLRHAGVVVPDFVAEFTPARDGDVPAPLPEGASGPQTGVAAKAAPAPVPPPPDEPDEPAEKVETAVAADDPASAASAPVPLEAAQASQRLHVDFDFDALARANIITPNSPRSQIADQYRVIKRPLISNAFGRGVQTPSHANLIMVTSAIANEGKSFTSINLAMSLAAELDNTVMLVDADLARPSLPRMLDIPTGGGLLDVLDGSADMASVLLRTNVPKLTLLRSGTPHRRATELLASDAMRQLLDEIAHRYPDRIVVFDSPPLLLTTESRVLATNMGQIVLVVRAGKTLQSDVQNALATIESCPVKMMLLNRDRGFGQSEYGLGYGYGYGGYGYGYGTEKKSES